jgi:hypothetical protein
MLEKALEQKEVKLSDYRNADMLYKLWVKAIDYGANRMKEAVMKQSPLMTKNQASKMAHNRRAVERALIRGEFETVKKGATTYIKRDSFEKWLVRDEILTDLVK